MRGAAAAVARGEPYRAAFRRGEWERSPCMNADEVRPRQQEAIVRKRFTAMQRRALAHPMTESDARPGPVWHASVCPPIRQQAKKLMAGVGEGVLFEEPGVRPDICHLRRRMAREEIELLEGGYAQ